MTRTAFAAALAAGWLLAGCSLTPAGRALQDDIERYGREAAAAALEQAEWWQCRASPVGAILDRYCKSEDSCAAWKTLCRGSAEATLYDETGIAR